MSVYPQLSNPDFYKISEEILTFWKENEIFEQSISSREGKETFTFYEGPPSANGTPGIHHVMARTIKDIFCRYQTLKGKQVKRKGGWDTHGLPIELQVEKELGITKDDIGKKISVEEYNQKCREAVMKFTDQWNELTEMMGYWVDLEDPYITYKNEYIESLWFLLKKLYDKGLLYKGYTIQPYSPAAGTGLSSHELNQPGTYKEVKDVSIVAQFKVSDWNKWTHISKLPGLPFIEISGEELTFTKNLVEARYIFRVYLSNVLRKETYLNNDSNIKIGLGGKGIKEIISFSPTLADTVSLFAIPSLLKSAIYINKEASYKGEGSTYHYLINKLSINGKLYFVKLVVQQIGKAYWLYDVALAEIQKSWNSHITQIPKSDDVDFPGHRKDKRFLSLITTKNSTFFEIINGLQSEPFILAWTTTPWTLPSNSALTVGKNIDYQLIETFNPYTHLPVSVFCAKERVSAYFSEAGKDHELNSYKSGDKIIPWKIVFTSKGSELEGIEYEQLMPYVQPLLDSSLPLAEGRGGAFRVILGDFVTTEDGTGVVHTAPTFGADDFRVAQQNGIPPIMVSGEDGKPVPLVNKQGRFVKEVKDYALEPVKEQYLTDVEKENERRKQGREKYLSVDERIGIQLKTENKAFNVQKFDHTYPHCWRTDKPVLYYPLDSWFIKTTNVKDKMIALNKQINWKPESTGTGRFGNWLENLVDWNLSRSRYWGTPLPIWKAKADTKLKCVGSIEELKQYGWFYFDGKFNEAFEKELNIIDQTRFFSGSIGDQDDYSSFPIHLKYRNTIFRNFDIDGKFRNGKFSIEELDDLFFTYPGFLSSILKTASSIVDSIDLHRPFIDKIVFVEDSENFSQVYFRESDLIDVWFDSGAMPYAQWHYPFENQEVFHKNFPADFISEGVDQTRGWFFTLHAIAAMLSDDSEINNALSPAFLNVVSTGLVLDKNGEKMSKRTGNVVNPFDAIRKYGPDPVRWYMITNSNPWDNLKFNLDGITEVRNKFFGTLANTYNFFALYANIDSYNYSLENEVPHSKRPALDRWILSKLIVLENEVDKFYADYEPTKAGRAIQDFVCDHLSNWYVRLGRKRFWKGEMTESKQAAYDTLSFCLGRISQLMSPIAPFFGEWLYRSLTANDVNAFNSVHLTYFQALDEQNIEPNLLNSMELAQRTTSLVHSLRKNHKLKVRQPLGRMLIPVPFSGFVDILEPVKDLILNEVNIKAIEFIDDASGLVEKSAKPNFKKLGKALGPKLRAFSELVTELSQSQINDYERNGELKVVLEGVEMTLVTDDLEIRSENIPGWVVASDAEITVAIDLSLTEELKMEGIARDVVNRVQNHRKDMGLEVLDRISLKFEKTTNDLVTKALEANKEYICVETQANSLEIVEASGLTQVLELDELSINFDIVKS